jgi:hypothetical protein
MNHFDPPIESIRLKLIDTYQIYHGGTNMEPITFIVAAVTAGIVAAARPVAEEAVKDSYRGLRQLIIDKYQARKNLKMAWQGVENDVRNELWQQMLANELKEAGADRDPDVLKAAQALNHLLAEHDPQAYGEIKVDVDTIRAAGGSIIVESEAGGPGQVEVKGRVWQAGQNVEIKSKTGPKEEPPA